MSRSGTGRGWHHALRIMFGVCAGLLWLGVGDPVAAASRPSPEAARTWQRQTELLDRTLKGLRPAVPGQPHLYFVGFAGYGPQEVFKREVLAVRKFFDARYGTEGRSIALVNHASTLAALPLASAGNLERTLQHLGKLMDPSRDVLFLFLTSHGEDGLFVVEMPRFDLKPLRPAQLKDMLKRSGIKNSVIVLSACHSGSFLPALADPTTLVIAAARADRSSFGCDDRRQWTYFGEAYFHRALRAEPSFVGAFERARELIAGWEAQAKLEPSLPQIGGGERLGPALAAIQPHH
jgi:peptidase C13-like protein